MSEAGKAKLPEGKVRARKHGQGLVLSGLTGLSAADPAFDLALRRAKAYAEVRVEELSQVHGAVGAGVSNLIATASILLAASRYLMQQAAEMSKVDMGLLEKAARMSEQSRRMEVSAAQVAEQEGKILLAAALSEKGLPVAPWLSRPGLPEQASSETHAMNAQASAALAAAAPTPTRIPRQALAKGSITAHGEALPEKPEGLPHGHDGDVKHAAGGESARARLGLKQAAALPVVTESIRLESALEPGERDEDGPSLLRGAEDGMVDRRASNR